MKSFLVFLLASAPVAAAPASPHCTVTIARAPDEVRPIVERWVRGEPSCNLSLEVRIVATANGLYILARDDSGRVRERIVPDAQSAGVLVASWIADDTMRAPGAALPPPAERMPPPAIGAIEPAPPSQGHWVSLLGSASSSSERVSIRLDVDLLVVHGFAFGVAGSLGRGYMDMPALDMGSATFFDRKVAVFAAHTDRWNAWRLREQASIGIMFSDMTLREYNRATAPGGWLELESSGQMMTADVSVQVARELGDRFEIAAGPALTFSGQETFEGEILGRSEVTRGVGVAITGGVRYRLW